MRIVRLAHNRIAFVDDADYDTVKGYRWCISSSNYAMNRHLGLMHRFILKAPIDCDIHHEDGNGLNNTRANIRIVSHATNMRLIGVRKNSKYGYKGVRKLRNWFVAEIQGNGGRYYLGRFHTPEEAARAYDKKAKELWGSDCYLNFPSVQKVGELVG
jgi:AP2 domain